MDFIKSTEKKGNSSVTDIIEGRKTPNNVFMIERFVCTVHPQETESETQQLADRIIEALEAAEAKSKSKSNQ